MLQEMPDHPTNLGLHQAALLDLQRSGGNALVLRQLAGNAPASATATSADVTVQRDDGPNTQPTEFVPVTSSGRATSAHLKVFEHYIHTWEIDNWRNAPRGTFFHWGWGVDRNGVAETIGDDTDHNGATRLVWVQAKRPGIIRIQGTPVHQVPGGPQITGDTRWAELAVQRPTLELLSIMPRRADGGPADSSHLSVGDKLIVRLKIGNVDGEHMEDPAAFSLSDRGLTNVEATPGATPVQSFPDGKSYDVELTATSPGSLNLALELGIGTTALGQGPKVRGITGEIEFDRQGFINLANQCDTKIERAYTRADSIMEVLSAAYGNAYDKHDKTLIAQDASNRLVGEILLNAALAFIPGGVGGVVGGMMRDAQAGDFLIDAVKDLAKAGTRGLQGAAVGGGGGRGSAMQPMSDDPRTWRAEYAVRVNSEREHVLDTLDGWKTKANSNDVDFFMNFNPVTEIENALVQNGQPLKDIPVPNQTEHERLFELGMWRTWLETYGYTVVEQLGQYGHTYHEVEENQGKKIRNRINALGENGDEWLERYGGVARTRAEEEVRRRRGY